MKTIIKIGGQNSDETEKAITAYNNLQVPATEKYISFGDNLIQASEVVNMLQYGFKASWDINTNELIFYKKERK